MKNKGQTLIEVLVGFTAMVVIVGAITMLSISALNNAQYAKNQSFATQYAQQGIEMMRNLRDTDLSKFNSLSSHMCLAESCTSPVAGNDPSCGGSGTCSINVLGTFIRDVTVTLASPDCGLDSSNNPVNTKVIVGVSWADGKCSQGAFCHTEKVTTCFSTSVVSFP